jgi:hypothetical protein
MDKPIAWYDPTNGAVSTDKDSPLFTPLGQVWPLYTKQEDGGWTPERIAGMARLKAQQDNRLEPVAYINVEQRKLEWAKYMSWDTPTVVNLPKIPLYTTPPQRTWVGLTNEELSQIEGTHLGRSFAKAIEAKLKEKNT